MVLAGFECLNEFSTNLAEDGRSPAEASEKWTFGFEGFQWVLMVLTWF